MSAMTTTPAKSSVNPKRASAGSISRTRISDWIVVSAVPIARKDTATLVEHAVPDAPASGRDRNRSRCAENA